MVHEDLRHLRFAAAALAADDNRLAALLPEEVPQRSVRDCIPPPAYFTGENMPNQDCVRA